MKQYGIKYKRQDVPFELERCSQKECKEKPIGCVKGRTTGITFAFCIVHEDKMVNGLKAHFKNNIDPSNLDKDGWHHSFKLIYLEPQPIPKDIQELINNYKDLNIKIFAIDSFSLDALRGMIKAKIFKKFDKNSGELDFTISDLNEN